ncbi:uncharacterized protein LOC100207705 [Hydra vulgaris]|uniref:uncharacterized protein LOC100207705 n=1 Tax=Hydra vulgaris TaxID=6087 RepID=UPI0002B465EE|nr:uncharacterized protein LOC100207705 [Hydra vulgaris]
MIGIEICTAYLLIHFGFGISQMPNKSPILPIVEDLPFIKCDVCQKAAKVLFKTIENQRSEKKLDEDDVLSIVEKSCDTDVLYGDWISRLDIVEKENDLKVVEHPQEGKCDRECKTISRSCEDIIGDIDTDIGELLWKNEMKLATFINHVCYKLTNSCKAKKKYVKGSHKDYKFVEMSEKEKQARDLMRNMKSVPGMPGMEMYSQDDLQNMREQMGVRNEDENQQDSEQSENYDEVYRTKLGFFETLKFFLNDLWKKIKYLFSYISYKKEL